MAAPAIALSDGLAGRFADQAAQRGLALRFARVASDGQPLDDMSDVQAVFATGISQAGLRQLLRDYPAIRWVAAQNAGVDALMLPEIKERRIAVTRVRHVHDTYVSEFSVAAILTLGKGLPDIVRANERREWLEFQPPMLRGQTVTIVGYGEIGRAIAKRAKPFELRVIGIRVHPRPDGIADEVWGTDRLEEALAEADYVVLIVPGGDSRRHLIGEPQLRKLKKGAFLINVGRGDTVDEAALDYVLRQEGFAGALLDVFQTEPLPKESPLWTNPRVLVSGHLAGIRGGPMAGPLLDQILDNMDRFTRGEPLQNTVDVDQGY